MVGQMTIKHALVGLFGWQFNVVAIIVGKSSQQELEAVSHFASIVGKREKSTNACILILSCAPLLYNPRSFTQRIVSVIVTSN